MNLSDREMQEMTELCNALADDTLTAVQRSRLEEMLAASEAARRFYVRFTGLSASLCQYAEEELQVKNQASVLELQPAEGRNRKLWWGIGSMAAAAALVLFSLFYYPVQETKVAVREPMRELPAGVGKTNETSIDLQDQNYVAEVTDSEDCMWAASGASLEPGAALERGRRLELVKGSAEITLDCGAVVTVEAPALLELTSAWNVTLLRGVLSAVVPHEAIGFRVSNANVDVVDLGTEFSVVASDSGETEVYVHKGKVQTIVHGGDAPDESLQSHQESGPQELQATVLTADQSRQYHQGRIHLIKHGKPTFKKFPRKERRKHGRHKLDGMLPQNNRKRFLPYSKSDQ